MRYLKLIILGLCLFNAAPVSATEAPRETVVLLHGIARTDASLERLEKILQQAGYDTLAITYPSTKEDIDGIASFLNKGPLSPQFWAQAQKVHFVTHSMGGLVARRYLAAYHDVLPVEKVGRVVMLAPPNGGSEVADLTHKFPPYQWYYGPAGQELTTFARQKDQGAPWYEVGIIAGTKEWFYIVAAFVVPGKGDGRVSVESTKLPGMRDHITVPATHTFIMDRPDVHRQVVHFIREGVFHHGR
ncbi:MAG: alpha/beta fold hydrolase [Alphaproteobacteria bacterium]|nr:alpha/beta fold hydrolase [Alphaproteobacteria bacterium]